MCEARKAFEMENMRKAYIQEKTDGKHDDAEEKCINQRTNDTDQKGHYN